MITHYVDALDGLRPQAEAMQPLYVMRYSEIMVEMLDQKSLLSFVSRISSQWGGVAAGLGLAQWIAQQFNKPEAEESPGELPGRRALMRRFYIPFGLIALALVYLLLAGCVTLSDKTIPTKIATPSDQSPPANEPFYVMVWNIGYAGLGEESDFKADGGEMLRPPGKDVVKKNLAGIEGVLRQTQPDVVLMQELAGPGFLTMGVDVLGG